MTMWNANTKDGVPEAPKPGWQSGLKTFKMKVPIGDYLDEIVGEHLYDKHQDWCNANEDIVVGSESEVYVYVNVNTVTGLIDVVGVDGHPLDKTIKFKGA